MKKRNLLLAVMAALTLSGCMLNQTEEKVYKTAEELPDDPVERYKAVSSLCKFNGVDSRLCLNYQIEINVISNRDRQLTMCFISRDLESGDITYSKELPYSDKLNNEVSMISKEGCDIYNIKKSCRNYGYLEGEQMTRDSLHIIAIMPKLDRWTYDLTDFYNNITKSKQLITSEKKYSEFSYFNKACSLGDIESCAVVMSGIISMIHLVNDEYTTRFFRNNYLKLFIESQNNFKKLYLTDPKALRFQKFRYAILSKNFKEASKLALIYCDQYNDNDYCRLPGYGILGVDTYYRDVFFKLKLYDQGSRFWYEPFRDLDKEKYYEFKDKIEFTEEEKKVMKLMAEFLYEKYHI